MIKKLFVTGIISLGLAACNGGDEEATTEEHMHDHEAMEAAAETAGDESLYVPEGAHVFFANLNDGDTVTSPVFIQFGIEGMEVKPAGEIVKGTGHHHIIIDGAFDPLGEVVPADDTHIHFGGGQTETEQELTPGEHTLTMQFANGIHQSYGEQMSATITVYVVE
jgi:hypothetical protein